MWIMSLDGENDVLKNGFVKINNSISIKLLLITIYSGYVMRYNNNREMQVVELERRLYYELVCGKYNGHQ